MKANWRTYLILCFGLGYLAANCQPAAEPFTQSFFDLLGNEEMPNLTITADFDSIKANVRNKDYVEGNFEVVHSRKSSTVFKVKLRPRGKSRRMMCDFPPIKLKFDKAELESNALLPFNDFKLVTHCQSQDNSFEAVIRREYLVYQLYNLLTPFSVRARLAEITYKNTGSSFNKTKHVGIILEDAECLANRNGCKILENKVINLDSLHLNQERLTAVFQYMIGNADWSYLMGRNIELVKQADGTIMPVPYDFDYAGLVAAPYARANAALGQRTVLDRVYLGNSKTYEELSPIISYFKSKKAEILQTIEKSDALTMNETATMLEYIHSFYAIIENRERVEMEMLRLAK